MKLGITLLGELKEMKEKMDLVWNDLFERSPGRSEEDSQWAEKLPISEGMGRRSFTSQSNEHINSFRFSGGLGYSVSHAFGAAPDNRVPAKVYFNRN